jgi:exonuclease III
MSDFSILCWNVRGLNLQARRDAVHAMISTTTCHLACLQETKLSMVDRSIVTTLGGPKLNNFSFKPAEGNSGTRGGILSLWDSDLLELSNFTIGEFHISANVSLKDRHASFYLTVVYGPSCRGRKPDFLREMSAQRPPPPSPWLVLGDFNCTFKASDKNNS